MIERTPHPRLLPFVSRVWSSRGSSLHGDGVCFERSLPSGSAHLVIRLDSAPLKILVDGHEQVYGTGVLGGVRSKAYFKDVSRPVASVGAVLEPGALVALFGVPANELAETHTSLDALWGADADRFGDELASQENPIVRLTRFEQILASRLPRVRGLHPGVARALEKMKRGEARARTLSDHAELGPRRFAALFRESVGLSPKRWLRVRRFQEAVARANHPSVDWSRIALDLGYSDQPHLAREFREFAGITPGEYLRVAGPASPGQQNHVPVAIDPRRGPVSSRRG